MDNQANEPLPGGDQTTALSGMLSSSNPASPASTGEPYSTTNGADGANCGSNGTAWGPYKHVLDKIENLTRSGQQWSGRCPAHDDRTNSLSIGMGAEDELLLHCQAGCQTEEVLNKLDLQWTDLYANGAQRNGEPRYCAEEIYDYRDAGNSLLFQVLRYPNKDFPQRRPDGNGGWTWNLDGVTRVPYRLPQLLAANSEQIVFITEGEKDADKLAAYGLLATTNPGGAGKWREEYNQYFQGHNVVILPDNDEQGRDHARQVARALNGVATSVRVVELPDLPDKGDVSDWFNAGGTPEELTELAQQAPEWEPDIPNADDPQPIEADDDPYRLARLFVQQTCSHPTEGLMLRFWRDQWHLWDSYAYRIIPKAELRAELSAFIKEEFDRINVAAQRADGEDQKAKKVTQSLVSNTVQALASLTILSCDVEQPCWLGDDGPWPANEVLATKSGLVHLPSLTTGEPCHLPCTPRFFSANSLDYEFDAFAVSPNWLKFLHDLWPDDPQSVDTLQELMGYLLLPDTRQHKIFMLVGPPRSGKGTISRVIRGLVGEDNVAAPTLSSLGGNFGLWPLLGKTVGTISDARISGRSDIAAVIERLLSISGEDAQTVDRKNLTPVTTRIPVRFVILTNELPNLKDASGALSSRFILLHMTRTWYEKEDKDLSDKLLAERSGILNWAILGWQRLNERGYFVQPESAKGLLEDLENLSSPIKQFMSECCTVGPGNQVRTKQLFSAWKAWCQERGRLSAGNESTLGQDLRAALPGVKRTKLRVGMDGRQVPHYEGLALNQEGQELSRRAEGPSDPA